jgi:26S proteasome regulatory subunit N6
MAYLFAGAKVWHILLINVFSSWNSSYLFIGYRSTMTVTDYRDGDILTGVELDAMKAVAEAYSKRSLKDFEEAVNTFRDQLEHDPIVHRHLSSLYDTLLEQNLCRLIEPFSRVEIFHISELIGLPVDAVEKKLSQMILDKKFAGTLDQGAGCLIIFDDVKPDGIYPSTLETISNISRVVDSLYSKSAKIMA